MPSIAALILAAGESRRFGSPKALARFQENSAVERLVGVAHESGLHPVRVVLGGDADEVRSKAPSIVACVVMNMRFKEGQTSSVQAGWSSIEEPVAGVALFLVDQPLVSLETVKILAEEFLKNPSRAVRPRFGGRGGHPTFLPEAFKAEILSLSADRSIRDYLKVSGRTVDVAVSDPGVTAHFNTPAEYEALPKS